MRPSSPRKPEPPIHLFPTRKGEHPVRPIAPEKVNNRRKKTRTPSSPYHIEYQGSPARTLIERLDARGVTTTPRPMARRGGVVTTRPEKGAHIHRHRETPIALARWPHEGHAIALGSPDGREHESPTPPHAWPTLGARGFNRHICRFIRKIMPPAAPMSLHPRNDPRACGRGEGISPAHCPRRSFCRATGATPATWREHLTTNQRTTGHKPLFCKGFIRPRHPWGTLRVTTEADSR